MANGLCDSYCNKCVYASGVNGFAHYTVCNYYLITGIRRPCQAGDGCIVKQTGKKVSRWSYENNNAWETVKRNAKKRRDDEYQEKLKQLRRALRMTTKVCAECGQEFKTEIDKQIYCCVKCKNRAKSRMQYRRILDAKAKSNAGEV